MWSCEKSLFITAETENQNIFAEPELYFRKHPLLLGLSAWSFSTCAMLDAVSTNSLVKGYPASAWFCPHQLGTDAHLVLMSPTPLDAWCFLEWGQPLLRSQTVSSTKSDYLHPYSAPRQVGKRKCLPQVPLPPVSSGRHWARGMPPGRAHSWAGCQNQLLGARAGMCGSKAGVAAAQRLNDCHWKVSLMLEGHMHTNIHTHIYCLHHTGRHWTFRAEAPGDFVGRRQKNWGSIEENTDWCPWRSHFIPCSCVPFSQSRSLINNPLKGLSFSWQPSRPSLWSHKILPSNVKHEGSRYLLLVLAFRDKLSQCRKVTSGATLLKAAPSSVRVHFTGLCKVQWQKC